MQYGGEKRGSCVRVSAVYLQDMSPEQALGLTHPSLLRGVQLQKIDQSDLYIPRDHTPLPHLKSAVLATEAELEAAREAASDNS